MGQSGRIASREHHRSLTSRVIDLLKSYFAIEDRDGPRAIREKVTGKLLTLDRTLEASLPAFLSLLEVPAEDPQWQQLDPPQWRRRTLEVCEENIFLL